MTDDHPLDRPVRSALTSRQAALAEAHGGALRFAPAYGPFGAAASTAEADLADLAGFDPTPAGLWLVEATPPATAPHGMAIVSQAPVDQMVAERLATPRGGVEIVPLGPGDAPAMRELATLTRPGPFHERTHELGRFVGVWIDGRLAAMAGERMAPTGFTEVSAVCTHPDFRGRGYAATLMLHVAARIAGEGDTPFLHTYPDNAGAVALYETLGFRRRRQLVATVLQRV